MALAAIAIKIKGLFLANPRLAPISPSECGLPTQLFFVDIVDVALHDMMTTAWARDNGSSDNNMMSECLAD